MIVIVIVSILLFAFVFRWKLQKNSWKCLELTGKNASENESDTNGYDNIRSKNQKAMKLENIINPNEDLKRQAFLLSYNTKREISRSLFKVTELIGSGNFGNVWSDLLCGTAFVWW